MREKLVEFEGAGVRLACVVQGDLAQTARFCGRHGVEQICIPDPEKESYSAMGFPRARWRDLLKAWPDIMRRRKEANAAGCGVSISGSLQKHRDALQLPGAALIARGGKILWLHRGTHPGDLPLADELLTVVREILRN